MNLSKYIPESVTQTLFDQERTLEEIYRKPHTQDERIASEYLQDNLSDLAAEFNLHPDDQFDEIMERVEELLLEDM